MPLSLADLRAPLDRQLAAEVRSLRREWQASARDGIGPTLESLERFLLHPGKRLRPLLFLAAHALFSRATLSTAGQRAARRVASALELFHSFVVVHDDLIDRADTRRGRPSLHRFFEQEGHLRSSPAESFALVCGDLLFGHAQRLFLESARALSQECGLPAAEAETQARDALDYFLAVVRDTGLGEGLELLNGSRALGDIPEENLLRLYHLKTTRYTFEAPLLLGARLAGATEPKCRGLQALAEPIGLAFQIENDAYELSQVDDPAAELGDDLVSGVRTLPLKRLHAALAGADRAFLEEWLADHRPLRPDERARLSALLKKTGLAARLDEQVDALFTQAAQAARSRRFSPAERAGLAQILAYAERHRRHSESAS